jgi:hypothetical protein
LTTVSSICWAENVPELYLFTTGLERLPPIILNPHQPRFMALSLGFNENLDILGFGGIEQAVGWKNLFTDATPAVAAGVNNRVT